MANLLKNDYNNKHYSLELNTTKYIDDIDLPNGHLGLILTQEDDGCYYVIDFEESSSVKDSLQIGDLIISINGNLLNNYDPQGICKLFKNKTDRKLLIKRD